MSNINSLFSPFSIGSLTVQNRIVMAPMTRSRSEQGIPNTAVAAYYEKRALKGVGLILTEGAVINHPASSADANVPHFFGDEALAGWKHVVDAVHAADGRIVVQLWHIGSMRKLGDYPNPDVLPVSPSGLVAPGVKITDPLSLDEIDSIIQAFANAALQAKQIGFDGIELHGAHGYLIDQFLWSGTNERVDQFGGSIQSRAQFAADIIRRCRKLVGPDFPIIFRFSQWKVQDFNARLANTPEELEQLLKPLVDAGVDIFHCSTRYFWEPAFDNSNLTLAGWTKKITGKPTIAVGSIGLDNDFLSAITEGKGANVTSLDRVEDLIQNGEADLIAVGRALLADAA